MKTDKKTRRWVRAHIMQSALDFNGMLSWQQIVELFSESGVKNWETEIRGPLQSLLNDGTLTREPDVRVERYLMLSHATARSYYESKYPSPADPGRSRGETDVATKKKVTKKAKGPKKTAAKKTAAPKKEARAVRDGTIAADVRAAIADGGSNKEIAAKLGKKHPSVNGAYVAWYRWKEKKATHAAH